MNYCHICNKVKCPCGCEYCSNCCNGCPQCHKGKIEIRITTTTAYDGGHLSAGDLPLKPIINN